MPMISDTDHGMDEEPRFEAFFSTNGEQDTGLGLSTVCGIVKPHSGCPIQEEFEKENT